MQTSSQWNQATAPKHLKHFFKKNIFAFAPLGSKAAHGSTGPKAQLRVLQMARPPVALTQCRQSNLAGPWKILWLRKGARSKCHISLSHSSTTSLDRLLFSVCPAQASISKCHLEHLHFLGTVRSVSTANDTNNNLTKNCFKFCTLYKLSDITITSNLQCQAHQKTEHYLSLGHLLSFVPLPIYLTTNSN